MDGDPTPALTGRRRTRPTSIGSRNPWQPKPGRAPLILAHAAVQTNRATSVVTPTESRLPGLHVRYPRVLKKEGASPEQYPDSNDDAEQEEYKYKYEDDEDGPDRRPPLGPCGSE